MPTAAALQVLLHADAGPTGRVELRPNPEGRRPASFEDERTTAPPFGAADLLTIAETAQEHGYQVRRFELVDDRETPFVDEDSKVAASELLIDAFRRGGTAEATVLLTHELLHMLLAGVTVYAPTSGPITTRRGGVVITTNQNAATELLRAYMSERYR